MKAFVLSLALTLCGLAHAQHGGAGLPASAAPAESVH
jgi:hypothetical protein